VTGAGQADRDDGLNRAVQRYAWRLARGQGTLARHGDARRQTEAFAAGTARIRVVDAHTRGVLEPRGVLPWQFVYYYAFARRLAGICRTYTGVTRDVEAASLIDTWVHRGLDPETLEAVSQMVKELPTS